MVGRSCQDRRSPYGFAGHSSIIWANAPIPEAARGPIPTAYATPSAAGYGGHVGSVLSPARNAERALPSDPHGEAVTMKIWRTAQ
jgi:hypothetical protein